MTALETLNEKLKMVDSRYSAIQKDKALIFKMQGLGISSVVILDQCEKKKGAEFKKEIMKHCIQVQFAN